MSVDKRKQFIDDFRKLLVKYECYLTARDHWQGYAECGEDIRIEVEFADYRVEDIDLGPSFYVDDIIDLEPKA